MPRILASLTPLSRPAVFLTLLLILAASASATAPSEKTIYNFQAGNDGAGPSGNLVADSAGNLYGTTADGGGSAACQNGGTQIQGCGTIFELSPPSAGHGTWTETVLYRFQGGTDGSNPNGGLVRDAAGNLYGIATGNSTICICDVIFELSPQSDGTWVQSTLFTTYYPTDYEPIGALALDTAGNLYGFTSATDNCGGIFQLSPPVSGGYPWTETLIYQFPSNRSDLCASAGPMIVDKFGNLYGTTQGVVGGPPPVLFSNSGRQLLRGSHGPW
ncbi:MAG: choice-of-anchor tandem repeat GloVer-containing protein [Candidatus Sulfotelmatobacter sp.]